MLAIDRIVQAGYQPRQMFAPGALAELAQSIRDKGVLQPLLVRPRGEAFEIVAGERRWRAAQRASLHDVPVILLSWKEDLLQRVRELGAGAAGYIRKETDTRAIVAREVARAAYWTAWLVKRLNNKGRVAVAALNPHAGERGLLGNEEARAITPGIALARRRIAAAGLGVELDGPVPAESAFRIAASGRYAAVVAMYHDQATIPMKILGFGASITAPRTTARARALQIRAGCSKR